MVFVLFYLPSAIRYLLSVTMNTKWRLILDGKCDGYYNMAVDEAILNYYSSLKIPTLRIYGWQRPFISVGYNQDVSKALKPCSDFPFVRRITGGSAILHDNEITYSITCHLDDLDFPNGVKKSYEMLNSFIKKFYKNLGLQANFAKDVFSHGLGRYENFCFSSSEHFDFIINGKKIGGNAQRRRRSIIFQHGSIPYNLDFGRIEKSIAGAKDLHSKTTFLNELLEKGGIGPSEVVRIFCKSFESAFKLGFDIKKLSEEEKDHCYFLLETKYTTKEWNNTRTYKQIDFDNPIKI